MTSSIETIWHGCYEEGWQGFLVPEAFAHPAKVAFGLSKRIYAHLLERGYMKPGDTIVDPFAGVCGFAFHAMASGLRWRGVELEPRFVALGQENLDFWKKRWELDGGSIVQGDSRRLAEVLGGALADCVVGSPPYSEGLGHGGKPTTGGGKAGDKVLNAMQNGYGTTEGQLGTMPAGSVDAVVGSPPFSERHSYNDPEKEAELVRRLKQDPNSRIGGNVIYQVPGTSLGQLAIMPPGVPPADCIVGSPPFEASDSRKPGPCLAQACAKYGVETSHAKQDWEPSEGNIGNQQGDTFWSAAREIVLQCHAILKPGGVAVWVVKSFCRNGAIVDFPGDWRRLCEACGFVMLEEIHASLVKTDEHPGLFGEPIVKTTKRCSFFRRLYEKKRPDMAINYEDVIVLRKVISETRGPT